jgi:Protein of unknown function (DUF1559)
VCGPDGTPLLSWRVLILPFIEEQELYNQFRLNEAWDSPHNASLLDRMPTIYAPPRRKQSLVPKDHTVCHVFVGKGTPFEVGQAVRLENGFPHGLSNTLLFVEADEPVPWTKPSDLPYDPDASLPPLRGLFDDGFRACTADGGRKFVRYDVDESLLRAAITRNGHEAFGADELP